MRSTIIATAALLQLACAIPAPQDIDFAYVNAVPDPPVVAVPIGAGSQIVSINAAAVTASAAQPVKTKQANVATGAASKMKKRDTPCGALPAGSGPVPSPDTDSAFLADSDFSNAALNAQTPSGYVQSFQNLQASNFAYGYLGYTTLTSYDPAACSQKCDNMYGCASFGIYFERDPTVTPADACPNPASTTVIKCAFWGGPATADNAQNNGQYRNNFHVVIAGSNGYVNNSIDAAKGYNAAVFLGNAAINAPPDCANKGTYMGYKLFTPPAFDAGLCAAACSAQSDYNRAHPPTDGSAVMTCQFFNTYLLLKNGVNQGQYCAMYSQAWDTSYATNVGQYDGQGNHYTITYSYTYTNATNPGKCSGTPVLSCPYSDGTTYTAANGKQFKIECQVDHAGGDLSSVTTNTLQQCVDTCSTTSGCVAYSWVAGTSNNGMPCYMKSSVGTANKNQGVWGGKLISS